MSPAPLRVPHRLPAARPVGRTSSLRFPAPSTTSLGLAPCETGCHTHLGSALRLFQPRSGFLAVPSFAGLFHPATVRGVLPSEFSPRRNRVPLSRPPAPSRSSTGVLESTIRALLPPVSSTSALARGCLTPPKTKGSLSTLAEARASRSPWTTDNGTSPFRQLHPSRSLSPPASPFAPTRVAPSQRPILTWVPTPPELSPSTPRTLMTRPSH